MSKILKQMSYDTIEAHQETIADLRTQLEKANERVKELESVVAAAIHAFDAYEMDVDTYPTIEHVMLKNNLQSHLNKFAIEKKCEGINDFMHHFRYEYEGARDTDSIESFADVFVEQLRKDQE